MQEGTRLSHIASQTTAPSNLSTATAMTNETNIRTEENPLYTLPEAVMLQAAYAGHAFVHFAPEEDRANARKIVEQVSEAAGIVTVSANSEAEEVAKLKTAEMDIDPEVLAAIPSHLRDQLANAKTFAEFEAAIGPFQKARDAAVELVTKERQHEIHEEEERQAKREQLWKEIDKHHEEVKKAMDELSDHMTEEEKEKLAKADEEAKSAREDYERVIADPNSTEAQKKAALQRALDAERSYTKTATDIAVAVNDRVQPNPYIPQDEKARVKANKDDVVSKGNALGQGIDDYEKLGKVASPEKTTHTTNVETADALLAAAECSEATLGELPLVKPQVSVAKTPQELSPG